MKKNNFRKDINGLRAISVLSVILFHFNNSWIQGGFAGVDVFFVISGFLMTSIIFKGIENNNFSIIQFIKDRINRIVPTLLTVISILIILGFFYFEPLTYQLLGKHAVSSLLFISNYIFSGESGYFDVAANEKILLHTWSLSVEWQFYILYPIVVYLLSKRLSISSLKKVIITCFLLSFFFSVFFTKYNPTFSYFMLYSRAWEIMIGGLAFLYPLTKFENHRNKLELSGLILIISSFFVISNKTLWPGYMAIFPVIGAYICIIANNKKSLLSNIFFQKIGMLSYSMYLIHWPILVFLNKINVKIRFEWYFLLIILSSFIIYKFVEKKRNYKIGLAFSFLFTLFLSLYISHDGIAYRVDNKYQLTVDQFRKKYYGGVYPVKNKEKKKVDFILGGDSYALMYIKKFNDENQNYYSFASNVCMFLPDYSTNYDKKVTEGCNNTVDEFFKELKKDRTTPVIISQNWNAYYSERILERGTNIAVTSSEYEKVILKQIEKILSIGGSDRNYFIIGTYTHPDYDVYSCLAKPYIRQFIENFIFTKNACKEKINKTESTIDTIFLNLQKKHSNLFFIDPKEAQCDKDNKCYAIIKDNIFFYDGDHLSIFGANLIGDLILNKFHSISK
ncbi:acyltransferase family protein [Arsenophonus nasoniae]|uniref:acyltransferase family protein n=1 Tax=Arsenophonus nasoniae TaxID=638 RepID=UPI0038791142